MNHYLTTFEIDVDVKLDELKRRQAMRTLNQFHSGKEQIPLNEYVPPACREAAYNVCATYRKTVTIGVRPDGRLEIIND